MKYCTSILFCLCSFIILGQKDTINVNFIEAQPIWVHATINNIDIEGTKYYQFEPSQILRKNDSLYLLCASIAPNGDYYGYIMEKLDLKTGELYWSNQNTFYHNKSSQEVINYSQLNSNNDVVLIGRKRNGTLKPNPGADDIWINTTDKPSLIYKTINPIAGVDIDNIESPDTIDNSGPLIQTFIQDEGAEFLSIKQSVYYSNDPVNPTNFAFYLYPLDSQLKLYDQKDFDTIVYQTNDTLGFFSIAGQLPILKIDENTIVGLVFQDYHSKDKYKVQLIWMDISDIKNINVIRRQNIENIIPSSFSRLINFTTYIENKQIVLSHDYNNDSLQTYLSYVLWLNEIGNIQAYIPECRIDDHYYKIIKTIYVDEKQLFLIGWPSVTKRNGFDILKVNKGSTKLTYVSSLTSPSNEVFTNKINISKLYEDGKFIIGSHIQVIKQNQISRRVQFHCFNAKDLGINLTSSVLDVDENKQNDFFVYPNPTSGIVHILNSDENTMITLFDQCGKIVPVRNSGNELDITHLPDGVYYLKTKSSTGIQKTDKIVKITK